MCSYIFYLKQKNKHVEALRNTTLPFPDLCAKLFDGSMSTGIKSWGPTSSEPMPNDDPLLVEDDQELEMNDTQQHISLAPQSSSRPQVEKKKGKQAVGVIEDEIMGVLKLMAEKHNKVEQPTNPEILEPHAFEDCLNKLNELGWDEDNLFYDVALAIFSDSNDYYRKAWMKLKPNKCVNWVGMIGRNKGFM